MLTRVRSISQVLEPVRLRLSLDLLSRLRPSKNTRGPTASVVVDSVQACRPVFGGFGVLERCCGAPAATSRVAATSADSLFSAPSLGPLQTAISVPGSRDRRVSRLAIPTKCFGSIQDFS